MTPGRVVDGNSEGESGRLGAKAVLVGTSWGRDLRLVTTYLEGPNFNHTFLQQSRQNRHIQTEVESVLAAWLCSLRSPAFELCALPGLVASSPPQNIGNPPPKKSAPKRALAGCKTQKLQKIHVFRTEAWAPGQAP